MKEDKGSIKQQIRFSEPLSYKNATIGNVKKRIQYLKDNNIKH